MTVQPKRKRFTTSPQSVETVLPRVGQMLHLDRKIQEWSLCGLWETVVDPPFQRFSKATKIKLYGKGKHCRLWVDVCEAAVASELGFYLETYRARLNGYAAQTGLFVEKIELRVTHFQKMSDHADA